MFEVCSCPAGHLGFAAAVSAATAAVEKKAIFWSVIAHSLASCAARLLLHCCEKQELALALDGLPLIKAAAKDGPSWAGYYLNKMIDEVSKEQIALAEDKVAAEALLKMALEE